MFILDIYVYIYTCYRFRFYVVIKAFKHKEFFFMKNLETENDCNKMLDLWMRLPGTRSTVWFSFQTSWSAKSGSWEEFRVIKYCKDGKCTTTDSTKSWSGGQPRKMTCFHMQVEAFKTVSNISSQNASIQLFQCVPDKLGDLMLANDPRLMAYSEEYVAKLMKPLAAI